MPAWEKVVCEKCGQEVSKSNLSKHLRRHELHPETFEVPKYRVNHDGLNCQYCGKEYKNNNSLRNHERLCKSNPNSQLTTVISIPGFNNKGRCAWNKGLTKDTDERILRQSIAWKQSFKEGKFELHSRPSENAYCTRYKYGTYKGYYCDSSWELAFIMYQLDNGNEVIRNKDCFNYTHTDGSVKRFFPDFKINEVYYEIKGGYDTEAEHKLRDFPEDKNLIWISNKEIKFYLDYAIKHYGKDFINLYDKNHPSWMDNMVG